MTMMIDLSKALVRLRDHGMTQLADGLEGATDVLEAACESAGFTKADGAQTTLSRKHENCSIASADDCNPIIPLIQQIALANCQKICDPCYLRAVVDAAHRRTLAEVKGYIGRNRLRFVPTGVTGNIKSPEGEDSELQADFPVAAGESILLRQEDFPFPWIPGCLTGALFFNGGTPESNYGFVQIQFFAGAKGAQLTAEDFGVKWNDNQWIYGSEMRCGDGCKDVDIAGLSGCGLDLVGELSELRMVIFNTLNAPQNIIKIQLWAKLSGMVTKCCDDCFVGRACACKKH
jgi:hypothetical protein